MGATELPFRVRRLRRRVVCTPLAPNDISLYLRFSQPSDPSSYIVRSHRTFGASRFDLIHARFLLGAVRDHAALYNQVYDALKPGGCFEISELQAGTSSDDGSVTPDMPSVKRWSLMQEAFTRSGRPIIPCEQYLELLAEAGFEDIQYVIHKRPTNDWPRDEKTKEIGRVGRFPFLYCVSEVSSCSRR